MNILIANFGNDSIALIAWMYAQKMRDVQVISVDTGIAHPDWQKRVDQAEAWVKFLEFGWVRLTAKPDFAGLVKAQGEYPTAKFQWCATFLKGETIRRYLDQVDSLKEAEIWIAGAHPEAKREGAEEFGDRLIHYPFHDTSKKSLQDWLAKTPFTWILHHSLECDPCVRDNSKSKGCGSFYGCGT